GGRFLEALRAAARRGVGGAFEKEGHRYLQNAGNLLQPACPDPIGPLLVFLYLLKREPERVAELFLAHRQHHPPHSNPAPNVFIDGIGSLLGHLVSSAIITMYGPLHCEANRLRFQRLGGGYDVIVVNIETSDATPLKILG